MTFQEAQELQQRIAELGKILAGRINSDLMETRDHVEGENVGVGMAAELNDTIETLERLVERWG